MIVEWILEFLHGLASTVFGWANSVIPSPPSFWTDAADAMNTAFGSIPAPVKHFVPIAPVVTAALAVVGILTILGFIRLGRRVLSLFTGGGGMA